MSTGRDQDLGNAAGESEALPEKLKYSFDDLPHDIARMIYDLGYYTHKKYEAEWEDDPKEAQMCNGLFDEAAHLLVKRLYERGLRRDD